MTSSDKQWLVRAVGHVSGLPPAGEQYWTTPTPTIRNLISGGHLEVLAKPVTEPEPAEKPSTEPTEHADASEPTPEPSPKRRKGKSGPGDEE